MFEDGELDSCLCIKSCLEALRLEDEGPYGLETEEARQLERELLKMQKAAEKLPGNIKVMQSLLDDMKLDGSPYDVTLLPMKRKYRATIKRYRHMSKRISRQFDLD
ncbi:MAG: hypothetical protein IJY50_07980 [Clostridia bacterium]|nr:hypothetical protein [Clostridia bacterium]